MRKTLDKDKVIEYLMKKYNEVNGNKEMQAYLREMVKEISIGTFDSLIDLDFKEALNILKKHSDINFYLSNEDCFPFEIKQTDIDIDVEDYHTLVYALNQLEDEEK